MNTSESKSEYSSGWSPASASISTAAAQPMTAAARADKEYEEQQLAADVLSKVMSEQTTIAFLAAIIASIACPNLLSAGEISSVGIWNSNPWIQWLYGFLWCWATTSSLLSIMLSFSVIISYNACLKTSVLKMHADLENVTWAEVYFPENTPRWVIFVMMDAPIAMFFFTWKPNILKAPLYLARASVFWLLFAICMNIYFNINAYFITHMVCLVYGLPVIFRYHECLLDFVTKSGVTMMLHSRKSFVGGLGLGGVQKITPEYKKNIGTVSDGSGSNQTGDNHLAFRSRKKGGINGFYETVNTTRPKRASLCSPDKVEARNAGAVIIQSLARMILAKYRVRNLQQNTSKITAGKKQSLPDYKRIYTLLTDKDFASDPIALSKFLLTNCCKSDEDLEFLEDTKFDELAGFLKPGVPRKKLLKLLNRL